LTEEAKPVMVFNFQGHVVDVHEVQGSALYRKKRGLLVESVWRYGADADRLSG
jgi:hypothetical protein